MVLWPNAAIMATAMVALGKDPPSPLVAVDPHLLVLYIDTQKLGGRTRYEARRLGTNAPSWHYPDTVAWEWRPA